jgi:hypothetical protein
MRGELLQFGGQPLRSSAAKSCTWPPWRAANCSAWLREASAGSLPLRIGPSWVEP